MEGVLSLYELNAMIHDGIQELFQTTYWVQAEVSSCSCRNAAGHCYLELIEKDRRNDSLKAKAKANIWRGVWTPLRIRFERETGAPLSVGQKILAEVRIDFHELYGMSLTVVDIDPSYTLGDWARRRREILLQLARDGVADLNKELPWPELPQRVAVVSSEGAAGYGDFCHQIGMSPYRFHLKLFPAIVQGPQAEQSIIKALEAIAGQTEQFDIVVIIRGGGAVTDLSCFDSYELASAVAQFPLPVLAGIGHERDRSVVDEVAHLSVKTPTAAAEHLVGCMDRLCRALDAAALCLKNYVSSHCERENIRMDRNAGRLRLVMTELCHREDMKWQRKLSDLFHRMEQYLKEQAGMLLQQELSLRQMSVQRVQREYHRLELREKDILLYSPAVQLKRGYSITTYEGKPVKDAASVPPGARIETRLSNGVVRSVVESKQLLSIKIEI